MKNASLFAELSQENSAAVNGGFLPLPLPVNNGTAPAPAVPPLNPVGDFLDWTVASGLATSAGGAAITADEALVGQFILLSYVTPLQ